MNNQPLKFHRVEANTLYNRNIHYGFHNIVPLIANRNYLLPFYVMAEPYKSGDTYDIDDEIITCNLINYRTGGVTDLMDYLTFYHATETIAGTTYEYILYKGDATIPNLPQGTYRLYLVNEHARAWSSELFKIGFFNNEITFSFRNSTSFGTATEGIYFWTGYYTASYEAYIFEGGEYEEYTESFKDGDNRDVFSYRRADKLTTVAIKGDINTLNTLKIIQMCDDVKITTEADEQLSIEITDVRSEPVAGSYMNIIVQFKEKSQSVISVKPHTISRTFVQYPEGVIPSEGGTLTVGGKTIKLGGKTVKL